MYKSITVSYDNPAAHLYQLLPQETRDYLNNVTGYLDDVAKLLEDEIAKKQADTTVPSLWRLKAHMFVKSCRNRHFSEEELEKGAIATLLMYHVFTETLLHFSGVRSSSIMDWMNIVDTKRVLGQAIFDSISENKETFYDLGNVGAPILFVGVYLLLCDRDAFKKWSDNIFDGRVLPLNAAEVLNVFVDFFIAEEARGSFMVESLKDTVDCVDELIIDLLRGTTVQVEYDTGLDFESNKD